MEQRAGPVVVSVIDDAVEQQAYAGAAVFRRNSRVIQRIGCALRRDDGTGAVRHGGLQLAHSGDDGVLVIVHGADRQGAAANGVNGILDAAAFSGYIRDTVCEQLNGVFCMQASLLQGVEVIAYCDAVAVSELDAHGSLALRGLDVVEIRTFRGFARKEQRPCSLRAIGAGTFDNDIVGGEARRQGHMEQRPGHGIFGGDGFLIIDHGLIALAAHIDGNVRRGNADRPARQGHIILVLVGNRPAVIGDFCGCFCDVVETAAPSGDIRVIHSMRIGVCGGKAAFAGMDGPAVVRSPGSANGNRRDRGEQCILDGHGIHAVAGYGQLVGQRVPDISRVAAERLPFKRSAAPNGLYQLFFDREAGACDGLIRQVECRAIDLITVAVS